MNAFIPTKDENNGPIAANKYLDESLTEGNKAFMQPKSFGKNRYSNKPAQRPNNMKLIN